MAHVNYEDCGLNCCGIGELVIEESTRSRDCILAAREAIYIADGDAPPEAVDDPNYDPYGGDFNGAFLIFSHSGANIKLAEALARYIKKHHLGTVVCAGLRVNPNTGNRLKAYLWALDRDKVKHFGEKKPMKHQKGAVKDENRSS